MTLAECLKVVRADGTIIALTTHSEPITFDAGDGDGSQVYAANPGFYRESITFGRTLDPERATIYSLAEGDFDLAAIRQRRFDGATFTLFLVDYTAPTTARSVLLKGTVGRIEPRGEASRAELVGLKNKLKKLIVESVSPMCRADLGDARCGVVLSSFPGVLSGVTSKRVLVASAFPGSGSPGFFDDGKITFTSGALSGLSFGIATFVQATKTFTLNVPLPVLPSVSDGFNAFQGCKKSISYCQDIFDNVANFQGEPQVPEPTTAITPPLLAPGGGYAGTGGAS